VAAPPDPTIIDGEAEFEVDEILEYRKYRRQHQFLVSVTIRQGRKRKRRKGEVYCELQTEEQCKRNKGVYILENDEGLGQSCTESEGTRKNRRYIRVGTNHKPDL